MRVARRPTVFSLASTSHHFRLLNASAFVALWVVPLAMGNPAESRIGTRLLEEGRREVKGHGPAPRAPRAGAPPGLPLLRAAEPRAERGHDVRRGRRHVLPRLG